MLNKKSIPFFTLLLMISFAAVNAMLFSPALPKITQFFQIDTGIAQLTFTWFLIGYASGQLIYGPIANRFGRKPTLYAGISIQIFSNLFCILAGQMHYFPLLVIGRFLSALGSGVGLKMTFTLVNETLSGIQASRRLSYLMIAFAIAPGFGIMLGGIIVEYFSWISIFYVCAAYGFILLLLVIPLPETKTKLDYQALKLNKLIINYLHAFKNLNLIAGGLLMGGGTCFVYLYAAIAPFIAINMLHMNNALYGIVNLFPPLGFALGSIFSAELIKHYTHNLIIRLGILIALSASCLMWLCSFLQFSSLWSLFLPMTLCYFGLGLVYANAASLALDKIDDKAHGSAVISFINIGMATLSVLITGKLTLSLLLMPSLFILICLSMLTLLHYVTNYSSQTMSP